MWTKLPGQAAGSPFPLLAAIARPLRRGGLPLAFGRGFELGGVPLASSWLSCAMGVSLNVCCCPPRQRIDDDDAGNEVHVVHELENDALDDLPAVMSVMPPGHIFVPLRRQVVVSR